MDVVDKIIAYECDELSAGETIELFQYLIESGEIRGLQGHYGQTAAELIRAGYISCDHLDFDEWMDGSMKCRACDLYVQASEDK